MAAADDWTQRAPQVSGLLLRALADVALQHGVTTAMLFRGDEARFLACDPIHLRVPLDEYRALIARAIALTGEPALGLRCGSIASEASFDLLAPLVAHAPSLRVAVREASQFQSLAFEGAQLQLSERAGIARLCCGFARGDELTDRFLAELFVAGLTRMLKAFGGSRGDLVAASFEHRRPSHHRAYTEVFHGAERFGAGVTGIELPAALLDRPHLHFNPALQTLVHAQAEQHLAELARPTSLLSRLQALLLHRPAARVLPMDQAARQLGVSARSLRRHLAAAGVSYRALTQELQRERACALLRNPQLSLQAVGDALGFADSAAFHRAIRRWTGVTACEYRARNGA